MSIAQTRAQRPVLITGCSSGIGRHAAFELARLGYPVYATARRPLDVAALRREGLRAFPLDLDDSESIRAAVDAVLEDTGGRLWGLFNNGAYGQPGAVEDLSREALRAQFETNLFGWLELTNRVLPVLRRQGAGRIVQNSSVLGFVALPYRGAYVASKYALEGLTDTLRLELAGSGVYVSLIQPGPILSRFRANALAAFERHIDADRSVHAATYRRLRERLRAEGPVQPFTLGPEAVFRALLHALESRRPRVRYRVTVPTHLFAWLKRLLTDRALDALLRRV